jgi:ABC-type sugar transport system ATPase subunit
MDCLVQLEQVTKKYDSLRGGGTPAVADVSLSVAEGEAVAIMGPSGSGKSTLLNLIAGLDRPTSGTVRVGGQRVDTLSETRMARLRRAQIGMVFQFFNLLDDMTVADNVLLPAQLAGQSRLAAGSARFRRFELLYSTIWGVALLADCAARLVGAYTLPVTTMVWMSTVLTLSAIGVGVMVGGAVAAMPILRMIETEVRKG